MYCLRPDARWPSSWPSDDHVYEDIATKFFEHFLYIAEAMNNMGGERIGLWDDQDGFFYDVLSLPDGDRDARAGRSMVGLDPAVRRRGRSSRSCSSSCPDFQARLEWFLEPSAGPGGARVAMARARRQQNGACWPCARPIA